VVFSEFRIPHCTVSATIVGHLSLFGYIFEIDRSQAVDSKTCTIVVMKNMRSRSYGILQRNTAVVTRIYILRH